MKSIAIVTDSHFRNDGINNVGYVLKENLKEVFGNKVEINNYYIDSLDQNSLIEDDLVLAMANSRAIKIRDFVKFPEKIIVPCRTFLKSNVHQLFSIPANTEVLVVNNDIETVLTSISSLYDIGIKHLNLIPYVEGRDYQYINIAVSPSEPKIIPDNIKTFIDLGHRVLDIQTMLLISSMLNINDKKTQQNLYNYYQKIFSTNIGIEKNYNKLLTQTEILNHLLDLSNDGILLTSQEGKILICNKKFKNIFNIKMDITGQFLHEIFKELNLEKYYNDEIHDDLIFYKGKYITLRKENITHFDNRNNTYFTFQEVTYIKKLEQNLSKKLRQKGQIAKYTFEDIITKSDTMYNVILKSKKAAKSDINVLITGQTGTGKEVFAQAIHNASPRYNQPFVAINCAAMPESLLESELFGYSSGSFTGALKEGKKGLFEIANNGTIFLDEIGDMPYLLQSKLIRVLQEGQVMPIGSDQIIDIDVRVISATHRDLTVMMNKDLFRKDLFYRLNTFPIYIPPLRDRIEDIPTLISHFTNSELKFSKECLNFLMKYNWPGNIRELQNIASYITTVTSKGEVTLDSLPDYLIKSNSKDYNQIEVSDNSRCAFQSEKRFLKEKSDLAIALVTLKSISYLNKIEKTAGRKHLLNTIENEGIIITENKLRKVLKLLNHINLITIKDGRRGSFITEKGIAFLKTEK